MNIILRCASPCQWMVVVSCLSLSLSPVRGAVEFRALGEVSSSEKAANPVSRLDSLVVEVNGERRRVDPKSGISVIAGDLVTVVDAWLVDNKKPVPVIDVAGFSSRPQKGASDDRGKVIDTARDFDPRQSEGGKGSRYAIRALGPGQIYGKTFLNIEPPQLISFDVEVNGELRKVLPGERLKIGPRDGIRVIEIRTNVRGNENVRHDLSTGNNGTGRAVREIRFLRGELPFARIPIDWQGS